MIELKTTKIKKKENAVDVYEFIKINKILVRCIKKYFDLLMFIYIDLLLKNYYNFEV